jgi:hypothetical protein
VYDDWLKIPTQTTHQNQNQVNLAIIHHYYYSTRVSG